MQEEELANLVAKIRRERCEGQRIEVKSAAEGCPAHHRVQKNAACITQAALPDSDHGRFPDAGGTDVLQRSPPGRRR